MRRYLSSGSLRRQRPDRAERGGFTLVELLVVIAIIAMLVGLLLPAVMRAREAGRRATCLNNQQQIGKAILNYVTSKNKFPPLYSVQPQPMGVSAPMPVDPPPRVGWVPPMLPYLEQNPLYRVFQANTWNTLQNAEVETLNCPSRNPTGTLAPLSYVVNAGMTDFFWDPAMSRPMDFRENGLFFDNYAPQVFPTLPRAPTVDLSYLSMHDGASKTLLVSENQDATDWIVVGGPNTAPTYTPNSIVESWPQALIWYTDAAASPTWGTAGNPPTGTLLNKQPSVPPSTPLERERNLGRPLSNHPGGFIVTMAGGSARFMNDDIEYRVYAMLTSPDSANAKDPQIYPPVCNYPLWWHTGGVATNPLIPLTATDLE